MAPSSNLPVTIFASIPQDQALKILRDRLSAFELFASRPFAEVQSQEAEWQGTTESLVIRSFGPGATQVLNYARARSAGLNQTRRISFGGYGPSPQEVVIEKQRKFEARTQATRGALRGMITELEILCPGQETTGIYDSGDPFSFYKDLVQLLRTVQTRVLIADVYLGPEVFDLYLDAIPTNVATRVLTGIKPAPSANILGIAKLFRAKRPNFELRTSGALHDRVILIDDRAWVVGQSIKDAAHKKPTYMIEIESPEMRTAYEKLWLDASVASL